ncbi:MAG: RNA-binding S4 domain-containing protein [Ruminococcus sp.]|nr:RNA-binding S4 domain-containing protein [Ruminococcus sp.]MBQ9514553.1 RNA-binding S4 domain-containing protein [Ruminococcus sp.]
MRLDKYLKVSRIIKRRTVANEVCDAGKAVVNGKPARASYDVKVGDVVELNFESRTVKFRVDKVVETIRKEDVSTMYTPM